MRPKLKYQVIYRHRAEYSVSIMCRFFGVSRSGYYAFVHRQGKPEKDAALAEVIAQQWERSYRTYGYRRMWLWLKHQNIFCNPKTVLRIMKKYDLLSDIRRQTAYAAPTVQPDRRRWCIVTAGMVHGDRRCGAPGRHAENYSGMPLRLRMDSPSIWMV